MKKIIAVVGMCGSGKSEITKFFTDKGWSSIYFGGVTMEELKKRGMPVNEKNEKRKLQNWSRSLSVSSRSRFPFRLWSRLK